MEHFTVEHLPSSFSASEQHPSPRTRMKKKGQDSVLFPGNF